MTSFDNTLIYIFGMPRSGTSWLGQIFDSNPAVVYRLSPLFSYTYKNRVSKHSTKSEFDHFHHDVLLKGDAFTDQILNKERGFYPTFTKKPDSKSALVIKDTRYHHLASRLLELYSNIRVVYLVRNPCAAINSWIQTKNEFPENDDPLTFWKNGANRKKGIEEFWGFSDWVNLTKNYNRLALEFPENVRVVRYENLVHNAIEHSHSLFKFCSLEMTSQTHEFIQTSHRSHSTDPYAVYKSPDVVLNRWKKELPRQIQDEIFRELRGSNLEKYLEY
jgi:hypothetical protein